VSSSRLVEFAEARMCFRGLFLPSHLSPSNLRPLPKLGDGDLNYVLVSFSESWCCSKQNLATGFIAPRGLSRGCQKTRSVSQPSETRGQDLLQRFFLPIAQRQPTPTSTSLERPSHAKFDLSTYQALSGLSSFPLLAFVYRARCTRELH
jgi:hypothetical protein